MHPKLEKPQQQAGAEAGKESDREKKAHPGPLPEGNGATGKPAAFPSHN